MDVGVGGEGDVAAGFVEELVEGRTQRAPNGCMVDLMARIGTLDGRGAHVLIEGMLTVEAVVLRRGRARPRRLEGERALERQLFLLAAWARGRR